MGGGGGGGSAESFLQWVASTQEVVTPLIANIGKINDLRLHAFETIILRQNANGILSSHSSLFFGEYRFTSR